MRIDSTLLRAALVAAACGSAAAAPAAAVGSRSSVTYATYFGAFAIAGDSGSDGIELPGPESLPAAAGIAGSHPYAASHPGRPVGDQGDRGLRQRRAADGPASRLAGSALVPLWALGLGLLARVRFKASSKSGPCAGAGSGNSERRQARVTA